MIFKNFSNPNHVPSRADDFQEQLQITSLALESVSDGVLITDANGIITSANNSFYSITGWSEIDIIGRKCTFLQGPGDPFCWNYPGHDGPATRRISPC